LPQNASIASDHFDVVGRHLKQAVDALRALSILSPIRFRFYRSFSAKVPNRLNLHCVNVDQARQ